MREKFWHNRWQQNQIGFHQGCVNPHLQACWPGLGLECGSRVFVPLCGKSADMLWLRGAGHEVLGVEISPIGVRDFFAENNLTPQVSRQGAFERWACDGVALLLGDFFKLTADDLAGVAGIYDRAALIAWPPEMRPDYLRHLARIRPAAASILLVTMEYPPQEMDGPPFSVSEAEVRGFYEPAMRVERVLDFDALTENARLRERGLTQMREKVFRLLPDIKPDMKPA